MTHFDRPRMAQMRKPRHTTQVTFQIASDRLAGLQHDVKRADTAIWFAETRYAPDTAKRQLTVTLEALASAKAELTRIARQYRETF